MKRLWTIGLAAIFLSASLLSAQTPHPKHINKAIELLEQGQPIYYTGSTGGYEEGVEMAQTTADYINYGLENAAFDMTKLRDFMRGLVDGGPTKSGHRTPAVIVTLPISATDAASMRANAWMIHQVLAAGVHGILLCNANDPEAIKVFVEATRYVFAPRRPGLEEGIVRGNGSQRFAAEIWGLSSTEYMRRADPWPLNADGEILLGLKLETPTAQANAEKSARIPGIAFAEWGPGDMGFALLGLPKEGGRNSDRVNDPAMVAARSHILKVTKEAGLFFLNACNEDNVNDMLDEGVMICTGGNGPAATKGRQHTNRPQPW